MEPRTQHKQHSSSKLFLNVNVTLGFLSSVSALPRVEFSKVTATVRRLTLEEQFEGRATRAGKPGVKRDQRETSALRPKAARQASVQELGPTPAWVMKLAPSGLHAVRLNCDDRSPIGTQLREGLPCLDDSPRTSSPLHWNSSTDEAGPFGLSGRRRRKQAGCLANHLRAGKCERAPQRLARSTH